MPNATVTLCEDHLICNSRHLAKRAVGFGRQAGSRQALPTLHPYCLGSFTKRGPDWASPPLQGSLLPLNPAPPPKILEVTITKVKEDVITPNQGSSCRLDLFSRVPTRPPFLWKHSCPDHLLSAGHEASASPETQTLSSLLPPG